MQDWLFNSGGCVASHDFERGERVDFASGEMTAFMEETPVMTGISLYRVKASGRGSFHMSKVPPVSTGRLVLGCLAGGHGSWRMDGCETHDWRDCGRAYSLTPVDRKVSYEVSAQDEWSCVAIRIEEDALDTLAGDTRLPSAARAGLEGRLRDHSLALPMTPYMRQLMQDLLRPGYAGSMERLYRHSKALELAAHHLDLLAQQDTSQGPVRGRELIRIRDARDRLVRDLRMPPSLEELAASVNLTPRRLNAGFRAVYGTTVFDYLRDARMDAARRMLEDGLDMPLKQLAWSVGYGQISNFVTAFRRRYGVSPGRYRRRLDDE